MPFNFQRFSPTIAEIRSQHLCENIQLLQNHADIPLMAVVKANGYGHGAVEIVRLLCEMGISHFAVATLAEGIHLRQAGIKHPVLVMGAAMNAYLSFYAEYDLDLNISSLETLYEIQTSHASIPFNVHLKIDTGMARLGMNIASIPKALAILNTLPLVNRVALWSHFASSDEPKNPFNAHQLHLFNQVLQMYGDSFALAHIANSGGHIHHFFADFPKDRQLSRCGIAMYGGMFHDVLPLKPVMRFLSKVVHLKTISKGTSISYNQTWVASKNTQIATISAGYADGVPRALSNVGFVSIRGKRYPIVGRVCMDLCMVDVGEDFIKLDDEATFWGDGLSHPDLVAECAKTISYTLFTGIGSRVPRVWLRE